MIPQLICDDTENCARDNGGCSPDADCVNKTGDVTCTCKSGYTGDGLTCTGK